MSALGLGCVKTKSGRVFTQPGSDSVIRRCRPNVRFAPKRTRLGDLWARRYRVETEGFLSTLVTVTPNFALLEMSHPEVASLVAAMLQARDAVERRSWSHQQEPTGEAWWADVLADPRARTREGRTDLAVKQAFYRLADEKREIILVPCSKCDWRAAFSRDDLIASHGAEYPMPNLLNHLAAPSCSRLGSDWDRCGVYYVEPIEGAR
jgi:hypothetical protein